MTPEQDKMLTNLHRALMELPPGASRDDRPLIEDLRTVVLSYRRASWATRAMIWLLPTVALIGASIDKLLKMMGVGDG